MKLSEALAAVKPFVWDGTPHRFVNLYGHWWRTEMYICYAVNRWEDAATRSASTRNIAHWFAVQRTATHLKVFVTSKLEDHVTFDGWYITRPENSGKPLPRNEQMQQLRLQWMDTLIAELQLVEARLAWMDTPNKEQP